jgi:pimeloyl-ACP methyl ester carboxylesterase
VLNKLQFSHSRFWLVNVSLLRRSLLGLVLCSALVGCHSLGLGEDSISHPSLLAAQGFLEKSPLDIPVKVWVRPEVGLRKGPPSGGVPALVVIESDGASWGSLGFLPPVNPTPDRAVGAEIARALAREYKGAVIYLARHCQFFAVSHPAFDANCRGDMFWTSGRFSASVVRDMTHILEGLFEEDSAETRSAWILGGFSGGGTLAALLAMELGDVECLVTFAAPLDTNAWVKIHGLSPLSHSLNPADRTHRLRSIADMAFWYGDRDQRVPLGAAGRLANAAQTREKILVAEGFTHRADSGWVTHATRLFRDSCSKWVQ